MIKEIIVITIIWQMIGCFLILSIEECYNKKGIYISSLNYYSPVWLYKIHDTLNWFGVFLLFLFYNLLCPLVSLGYWFVQLCKVGRKSSNNRKTNNKDG